LPTHDPPTVADVDGDGNLELITVRHEDQPRIWDLVDWKLNAKLPFICRHPPGLADLDGDGRWEILDCNLQNITIFKYNNVTKNYDIIGTIPLANAHSFFIAQDIDADGKLELVFNQHNSWISVYDVEVPAPKPLPQSGLCHYHQYRGSVPVYRPPPGPQEPRITEVSPKDCAINVPVGLSELSFKLTDYQCDPINYTVTTNPDIGSASGMNVSNGRITVPVNGLEYSTTYTWTVTATDGINTITKTYQFTTMNSAPWYNTNWQYRKAIVIDHTKVAADQTNFPVLIDLTDEDLTKAQPDGADILFTDQNQNKLSHEIEQYDNATGRLIAWVNIPYLSSSTNTILYMYYGNPNCESQQNSTAVWDMGYKLLLHLNEETGIHYDSTINGNNGTPFGSLVQGVTGYIGKCVEFNGGYIELPPVCTSETQFTFSAWIYPRSGARYFISEWWSSQGAFLQVSSDGTTIDFYVNDIKVSKPVVFDRWYYVVGTFDGANAMLYVNGDSPVSKSASNPIWPSQKMYVGDRFDHTRKFNGFIDEVRVSNISRSAVWILTEYNNQLNPASFYTVCPEESLTGELVLTVLVDEGGTVIKKPNREKYAYGTLVQLTAVADLGYTFSHWEGNLTGNLNPATILMTGNKTVKAVFVKSEYTLTINVEGCGSVFRNDTGPYYYGSVIQLTAVPDPHWEFSKWSGDHIGTDNPATIVVTGNMNITAHFTKQKYVINASVSGVGGTIQPSGQVIVVYGQDQTFTITPDVGYHISDVIVDGISIGLVSSYTFYNVDDNHTIIVEFAQNQYILTINIVGEGSVAKNPNNDFYIHGDTVQLTASASQGWTFSGWSGDLSGLMNPATIVMTGNKTVTATFTTNQWWCSEWKYRRTITIDHTKVSGELTDFPVLIEITDSSLAEKAQPDGDDFVFIDVNNVKLDHQIEYYNNATGHLIAWVKVPCLSSTIDTVLYVYYGNPNCENQQNPTGVWDANYKMVLHLNEETGTLYDSTINGNNGTPFGSLVQGAPGYIGSCVEFNGGYILLPRIFTTETQFTFSAWIYPRSGARYFISQYQSPYQGAFLQVYGDNIIQLYVNNIIVTKSITINKWYYVVATFDGTTARLYVNDGSPAFASASNPIWASPNMYLGDRYDHVRKFYGFIDEVRVSNISRSVAWILTEYNNQFDPATFYSVGAEETFGEFTTSGNQSTIATLTTYGYAAVEYACQRKTFYANGRFWVFYYDGATSAGYSTSTDGFSWTPFTPFTSRACGAGWRFAVTFNGTYLHYVFSTGRDGDPLYYRCGLPNADGTITWLDVEQNITIGESDTGHLWPSIAIDSEGRP
jgi:uncharacterized repeat protein (TIGR02543 family)